MFRCESLIIEQQQYLSHFRSLYIKFMLSCKLCEQDQDKLLKQEQIDEKGNMNTNKNKKNNKNLFIGFLNCELTQLISIKIITIWLFKLELDKSPPRNFRSILSFLKTKFLL